MLILFVVVLLLSSKRVGLVAPQYVCWLLNPYLTSRSSQNCSACPRGPVLDMGSRVNRHGGVVFSVEMKRRKCEMISLFVMQMQ